MLKRISVYRLRVGMYVHELCGSWLDHPFWRSRFLIQSEAQLSRFRGSRLEWVWIDTDKGLDVRPEAAQVSGATGQGRRRSGAVQPSGPAADGDPLLDGGLEPDVPGTPEALAYVRAQGVRDASGDVVAQMFSDAQLGRRLDVDQAERLAQDMAQSIEEHPDALISLSRIKRADQYTYMHSVAVAALMTSLARELDLPDDQVRLAGMSGLLHDVGKVQIPEHILNKPGRLTDEEFAIVRRHPEDGVAILKETPAIPDETLDVCLHHHERMDGRGYPERLPASQITLLARMGAVCDVYDAVTSNRPYKRGWDPAFSLQKMAEWQGHFDPQILAAFVRALGPYPVGSVVSLSSGELAVVVAQNRKVPGSPVVKAFYSNRLCEYISGRRLDLSAPGGETRVLPTITPVDWAQSGLTLPQIWD